VAPERDSYRRPLAFREVARTSRAAMGHGVEQGHVAASRRLGLGFGSDGAGHGSACHDARAGADMLSHAWACRPAARHCERAGAGESARRSGAASGGWGKLTGRTHPSIAQAASVDKAGREQVLGWLGCFGPRGSCACKGPSSAF
jgi:hypothetical protein